VNREIFILMTFATQSHAGVVANTIFLEARGESFRGQVAVATVIYNRHKRSGRTLEEVCLRRKQFSCWNLGYYQPAPKNPREKTVLGKLELVERDMRQGTFRPMGRWTRYYNPSLCSPSWGRTLTDTKTIGAHRFGKE